MSESYAGFIDVGFLHAGGAATLKKKKDAVRLQASEIVDWLRTPGHFGIEGAFLRAYWYDGAYDPKHAAYENQRKYFNAIAHTTGIQLRLGHIAEHPSRLEKPTRLALANTARERPMSILPTCSGSSIGVGPSFQSGPRRESTR